jgi:hypothetical protein
LSAIRDPLIVEMEPLYYNDLFDFHTVIEVHRFLSRQQKDDAAIIEDHVNIGSSGLGSIVGGALLYEKSELISDAKEVSTGITVYGIEEPLFECVDSSLLAAVLVRIDFFHAYISPSLLSKMELLRTCCLRKFSSMVCEPWTAALIMAWRAS